MNYILIINKLELFKNILTFCEEKIICLYHIIIKYSLSLIIFDNYSDFLLLLIAYFYYIINLIYNSSNTF